MKTIYYRPHMMLERTLVLKSEVLFEGKADTETYYIVQESEFSSPQTVWDVDLVSAESYRLYEKYIALKVQEEEIKNDLVYLKKDLLDECKKDK